MAWLAFRSALQKVHLWAGLALAIPFILIGLSGSVLVLQPDLPRWAMPYAPARGAPHTPGEILKAAEAALPPGAHAQRLTLPQRRGEPAAIRYVATEAQAVPNANTLYIDPVSLSALGNGAQARPPAIFSIARTLHATLYVRNLSDRSLIGWLGIALTLLSLSGLILWWPRPGRWRGAFSVRRRLRGFRLHHDVHAVFGIWTLVLLLIVCISGVYLAFPRSFRAMVAGVLPIGQDYAYSDPAPAPPEGQPPLTVDEAVALAAAAVPDAEPLSFQLPNRPGQVLIMTLIPRRYGVGVPTILVSVDAEARQIAYVDDFRDYAVGERVILWQRALHSGLGLGLLYKALVFLSGLLPLLFGITGLRMWWVKRTARRLVPQIGAAEPAE
jgi:uncharacterized iron-regulated membrane protein